VIDVPDLNGNPGAIILATPILENGRNPNPHPIGAYFMYMKKWSIFNLDGTPISEGAKFNIEYYTGPGENRFLYTVQGYPTCIDNIAVNNNPTAKLRFFATGPPGRGSLFNTDEVKIFYNATASRWCFANLNGNAVRTGAAYSIVFTSDGPIAPVLPKPSPAPTPTPVATPKPQATATPTSKSTSTSKKIIASSLTTKTQDPKTIPIVFDGLNDFVANGLPASGQLPTGNLDQAAALMARTISKSDGASLPTLLAALQTAGFSIVDENRKVLLRPAGGGSGQGLLYYDWETVGMLKAAQSQIGTTLDKLTAMITKDTPEIQASRLSVLMLQDLRRHAISEESPFVRFWARLIIELGKNSPRPVDLMTPQTGDVNLSLLQASLLTRRLVGDYYAVKNGKISLRLQRKRGTGGIFAVEGPQGQFAAHFQQASYIISNECQLTETEALILDAGSYATTAGHDAVYELLTDSFGHGATHESLEKFGHGMIAVNTAMAWLKLLQAVTSIHGEIKVDGKLPLPRTKDSTPGESRLMKARFWTEVGRKQMLNCVRLALNTATGLDFSMPTDGPLSDKAVEWHFAGGNETRVNDASTRSTQKFVSFESLDGNAPQNQVTDESGISKMNLVGAPKIPAVVYFKSMEVQKQADVVVGITLKSAKDVKQNLIDIIGTAANVAVGGPGALFVATAEIGFRLPYAAAQATIPVTDHEPCDGHWKGTITYTVNDTSSVKHNVISGKGPMTITEGGYSNSEIIKTFTGSVNVNGNEGVASVFAEETSKNEELIFGQVWCSPRQGYKGTRGQSSSFYSGSGSAEGPTTVSYNFLPNTYSISISVPSVNTVFTRSSSGFASNDCDNNKPINSKSNYSTPGMIDSPNLPSAEALYGQDREVLRDSATGNVLDSSSTSADGSTTSTHTIVVTIRWDLRRCD
jgi:hypothetical protein